MRASAARNALLLLLSCAAGCIDALSYLQLGQVFVANMTGHAVLLGVSLVAVETYKIVNALMAICGFFLGAVAGSWMVDPSSRPTLWPRTVTITLWLESALLGGIAVLWALTDSRTPLAVVLYVFGSSLAMGLQSAAVRGLRAAGIATTYITGTLTTLAADMVALMRHVARSERVPADHPAGLLAGVWLIYILGATIGALLADGQPSLGFIVPAALTLIVTVSAAWRFRRAAV
ncbi:MAG TPA: YoaK family protein [Burkholderiales bacterium]